jgi:hypothetical protein
VQSGTRSTFGFFKRLEPRPAAEVIDVLPVVIDATRATPEVFPRGYLEKP